MLKADRHAVVSVSCPVEPAWKLTGQTVPVTIDVGKTVKNLCEELSAKLGVPVNKMQLKFGGAFAKPAHTLVMVGAKTGSSFELVPKTRGGKK